VDYSIHRAKSIFFLSRMFGTTCMKTDKNWSLLYKLQYTRTPEIFIFRKYSSSSKKYLRNMCWYGLFSWISSTYFCVGAEDYCCTVSHTEHTQGTTFLVWRVIVAMYQTRNTHQVQLYLCGVLLLHCMKHETHTRYNIPGVECYCCTVWNTKHTPDTTFLVWSVIVAIYQTRNTHQIQLSWCGVLLLHFIKHETHTRYNFPGVECYYFTVWNTKHTPDTTFLVWSVIVALYHTKHTPGTTFLEKCTDIYYPKFQT
jgi:hypothetical protein